MTFTVPGRLPGYNQLTQGHWAVCARIKAEAMETVGWCIRAARAKPVDGKAVVTIRCFEPNRRRDYDNVTSGANKCVLDALQHCGILKGDGQKYVERVTSDMEIDRKSPRVEITITEAEDG